MLATLSPAAPPDELLADLDAFREATRRRDQEHDRRMRRAFGERFRPIRGGAVGARLQEADPSLRPSIRRTPEGAPVIPFTSAAHAQTEGAFIDQTFTPGAAENPIGSPWEVPAGGYLRSVWVLVTGSGGTLGAGVLAADYPWNALSRVALTDVNGAPIFGPTDGYATLWQNILGAAAGGVNDPRTHPDYVNTINFAYMFRIPLEISHSTGLGSLANQDARAGYRVELRGNTSANMFSTAPTTAPAVRVRAYSERWTIPSETDVLGRPQAQIPPRLGTAQYVSEYFSDVALGQNTVKFQRTGNLLRTLIMISRSAAGVRQDTSFPDPIDFDWDQRHIHSGLPATYIRSVLMREKLPDLTARDAGVHAFPLNDSNHNILGDDLPTFWYPTVQSSRIEFRGSVAAAGRVQIVTGDVAPAEVAPEERYELASETGFAPEVGVAVRSS